MARLDLRKVKHVSRLELGEGPLTIGRASSNNVVLADSHVSRQHCVIEVIDGQVTVRDLHSHGGTFVNGRRIEQSAVHHGDRISVGPFDLLFKDPATAHRTNGELPLAIANDDTGHGDSSRSATGIRLGVSLEAAGEAEADLAHEELRAQNDAIEARLAELDQREAELKQRELDLQDQRALLRKQDAARIATLQEELEQAKHTANDANTRISTLLAQAEDQQVKFESLQQQFQQVEVEKASAIEVHEQSQAQLADLREQIASLEADSQSNAQRIDELQGLLLAKQQQFDQLDSRHRELVQQFHESIENAQREIDQLRSHESTLQEQVEALESARQIAIERADHASAALATLRGQLRLLDDAAQRVSAIQNRLAEIETAWVDIDQKLENAHEQDDEDLESAAMQRQRISDELETLNEVRDAAVNSLSETAHQLRSMTDQHVLQITTIRSQSRAQSRTAVAAGPSDRKEKRWWKFGR